MNVILFGATGMVGQGVLRECLLDPEVTRVVSVVRKATGQQNAKLHEIVHGDFLDYSAIEDQFAGLDACFYCVGVTSAGTPEDVYRRVTYDFTMAAARALLKRSPTMSFVFVSGQGADSTEKGRFLWARVKGKTENDLFRMPFGAVYVFRPGTIQPLHGIKSRTRMYQVMYTVLTPVLLVLKPLLPGFITTTEKVGRAMLNLARKGSTQKIFGNKEINKLAQQ